MAAVVLADCAFAADSPQFRGPGRDGIFSESGLLGSWPDGGPPKAWVATGLGDGCSTVSVVDGTLYVPGMPADEESRVFVLDADGNIKHSFPHG